MTSMSGQAVGKEVDRKLGGRWEVAFLLPAAICLNICNFLIAFNVVAISYRRVI